MYTKYVPCIHCCKYIVAVGIKRVVYGKIYRNRQAVVYLKEAGLQVEQYQENPDWQGALVKIFTEEIPTKSAPEVKFTIEK